MILLGDLQMLDSLVSGVFIVSLLMIYVAVTLYIRASKVWKYHGVEVMVLIKSHSEKFREYLKSQFDTLSPEMKALMEGAELDGALDGGLDGELGSGSEGELDPNGKLEEWEGIQVRILTNASRLHLLRDFEKLVRNSWLKASHWLFLSSYFLLQGFLLVRLELEYFSTQYSVLTLLILPVCLLGFLTHYRSASSLVHKLRIWSLELEDN